MLSKVQVVEPITLAELRNLTGLSIPDFSKKVEIPETSYRRYENEPEKIEIGRLLKICEITGVPIDKIKIF